MRFYSPFASFITQHIVAFKLSAKLSDGNSSLPKLRSQLMMDICVSHRLHTIGHVHKLYFKYACLPWCLDMFAGKLWLLLLVLSLVLLMAPVSTLLLQPT